MSVFAGEDRVNFFGGGLGRVVDVFTEERFEGMVIVFWWDEKCVDVMMGDEGFVKARLRLCTGSIFFGVQ